MLFLSPCLCFFFGLCAQTILHFYWISRNERHSSQIGSWQQDTSLHSQAYFCSLPERQGTEPEGFDEQSSNKWMDSMQFRVFHFLLENCLWLDWALPD